MKSSSGVSDDSASAAISPVSSWVYIVLWITLSCSMILFNKAILSQMNFPFPMFLTTWHMALSTICTQIMARGTTMLPGVSENKVNSEVIRKSIMPVAALFSISLVLSNKAYIYLSVSYIQMLKAFTPVSVLIFSYLTGLEKSSHMEVGIVMCICVGVAMTSIGETYFSLIGFIFQTSGIFAESCRLVLMNLLMKSLKLDPLSSLYYIAPVCFLFIGALCIAFEAQYLPYERMMDSTFILIMLVNGAVAFGLNVAVVLLIGHTSALVLTLSGILKDILLVFLSVLIFSSPVTILQYIGYTVALFGLNLHKEYKKNPEWITQSISYYGTCGYRQSSPISSIASIKSDSNA